MANTALYMMAVAATKGELPQVNALFAAIGSVPSVCREESCALFVKISRPLRRKYIKLSAEECMDHLHHRVMIFYTGRRPKWKLYCEDCRERIGNRLSNREAPRE